MDVSFSFFGIDAGLMLIVLATGLTTAITRVGGVITMSFVPLSPRVEYTLRSLAASVLIALIVPEFIRSDLAAQIGVLVTVAISFGLKKTLPAFLCGLVVISALRHILS